MQKNDCFLMRGSAIDEPMTVYCVEDVCAEKIWAKSLLVENEMVQGWPIPNEYDNNIPENAILLPADSWQWGKNEMLTFIKDTFDLLRKKAIRVKPEIRIGSHYVGGHGGVHTVTEIGEERIKFIEFRLDEDDISPCWKGEVRPDDTDDWYAISEETYTEVIQGYNDLLTKLRKKFCGL